MPGKFSTRDVKMVCAPGRSCVREDSAEAARWRAETKLEDAVYKKASDKIRAKVGWCTLVTLVRPTCV